MEDITQDPVAETPAALTAETSMEEEAILVEETPAPTNEDPAELATGLLVPSESYDMPHDDAPETAFTLWTTLVLVLLGVAAAGLLLRILSKRGGSGKAGKGAAQDQNGGKSKGDVVELYVGNLSYDTTEAQFRKEFERFGVVKSARIIGHRTSGKSKGYGFVEMPHRKEAMVAIKALNNKEVMGRKLRVNEARNGTMPRDR